MGAPEVIVVGAGLGGLSAAALLAKRGLRVTVFDQHFLAGGYCTSWKRVAKGPAGRLTFEFDCGVHDISGLGPTGRVRRLLDDFGIADRIEWVRVGHEYVLPGLRLKVPETPSQLVEELAQRFPEERAGLTQLLETMRALYDLQIGASAAGADRAQTRSRRADASRWAHRSYAEVVEAFVRAPALREALRMLTGYLSHQPETVSSTSMAFVLGYWFEGGFYPRGGAQQLPDALVAALVRDGGRVRLSSLVRQIRIEQGHTVGVELGDGEVVRADVVISNADVKRTFSDLVGGEHLPPGFASRVASLEPSPSALSVYLGLDTVPDLGPMTLVCPRPTSRFSFTVVSRMAPSMAPEGHASAVLTRLVAPAEAITWDRSASDYVARRTREGDRLLDEAEHLVPELRRHIVFRADASPATFARYTGATGGGIYGLGAAAKRLPSRTPVRGLYLVGAGAFPGAGVEAVLESGRLAADEVCPAPASTPA